MSHDASRTGAPLLLLQFLRWLRESNYLQFRILLGEPGPLLKEFESVAPVDIFEPTGALSQRVYRRLTGKKTDYSKHQSFLRHRLRESNIGVIYANTIATGRMLDFLSFLDCPAICHVHELSSVIDLFGPDNLRMVKERTDFYISVSESVKLNLVDRYEIPEQRIHVRHGFIDANVPVFPGTALDIREELAIPSKAQLVCACGSIEARKGVDLFLQLAGRILARQNAPPVHFVWIGGSRERVKCVEEEIRGTLLDENVHFIGQQANVARYYDAIDVFVLPSREDPFPLVMLEAALHKKPIVCFAGTGGAPEFVQRDAGFVVPRLDVEAMAVKTCELLDSAATRNQMGSVGRLRVLSRHTTSVGALQIFHLIQTAICNNQRADALLPV